jgi:ribosome-binding factor A
MPHSHNRMQRIGDQIQCELSQLLLIKTNDPRLHRLSITAVQVSPDMANATVFISEQSEKPVKETLSALNNAASFLRRELAHALNLRITPRLKFVYDKSILQANRLSDLIDAVNQPKQESSDV